MRNFQQKGHKTSFRRILESWPFLFLFVIVLVFFTSGVFSFLIKMNETIKNKKIAEDKVYALEQRKDKLITDINNLNTDKGKEKVFRENFGLGKEGEGMIVVVEDKSSPPQPQVEEKKGFLDFFNNLFN